MECQRSCNSKRNRLGLSLLTFLIISFGLHFVAQACTVFYATDGRIFLAGNNEDWSDPDTFMWFVPAQNGHLGIVYFGFGDLSPQGGMNEAGLFYDGLATPNNPIEASGHLPHYHRFLIHKVMEECSSVDDAKHVYQSYNLVSQNMQRYQLMVGDRHGQSAIIEGDEILDIDSYYQVCTNFYQSDPSIGNYPCWRYQRADEFLDANESNIDIALFRRILDEVHQEGTYQTRYSNVYDLGNKVVYLFHDRNFDEFVKIDLLAEMDNDHEDAIYIPGLFSDIEILSPENNDVVQGSSITIEWEGQGSSEYQIHCSTDSTFVAGKTVNVSVHKTTTRKPYIAGLLVFCLLPFIPHQKIKRISFILMMLFICACDKGLDNDDVLPEGVISFSETVNGLDANTKYYWKITADTGEGFESQTVVRSFQTSS